MLIAFADLSKEFTNSEACFSDMAIGAPRPLLSLLVCAVAYTTLEQCFSRCLDSSWERDINLNMWAISLNKTRMFGDHSHMWNLGIVGIPTGKTLRYLHNFLCLLRTVQLYHIMYKLYICVYI